MHDQATYIAYFCSTNHYTLQMELNNAINLLSDIKERALSTGCGATVDEAVVLAESDIDNDTLCKAADCIRIKWQGDTIETCSIVNARSGRCSEDCKWCAQSRHHHTGVEEYDIIPMEEMLKAVRINTENRVKRFSLVTSGRKVSPADIDRFADMYREIRQHSPIKLCASMGLLNKEELQKLRDAGVSRYHCNLETSSDYFPTLCSTHSHEDKLRTIRMAREVGMEVCSGGIIGMGESMRQRLTMVAESIAAGASSIPVNILNPIPGTPLADTPLISEEEIVRSMALFRLIAPKTSIRFAGGRKRISEDTTYRMLLGGANGALVGDMLTTIGNTLESDKKLFAKAGYKM